MKRSTLLFCLAGALLLIGVLIFSHQHMAQRRARIPAVVRELNGHTSQIAVLLATMRGSNAVVVEDTIFQELQDTPSTSLILRSHIKVAPAGGGRLLCVIDTSPLGIAPRTIWSRE